MNRTGSIPVDHHDPTSSLSHCHYIDLRVSMQNFSSISNQRLGRYDSTQTNKHRDSLLNKSL